MKKTKINSYLITLLMKVQEPLDFESMKFSCKIVMIKILIKCIKNNIAKKIKGLNMFLVLIKISYLTFSPSKNLIQKIVLLKF